MAGTRRHVRHVAGRQESSALSLEKGQVKGVEISKPSSLNEMSGKTHLLLFFFIQGKNDDKLGLSKTRT